MIANYTMDELAVFEHCRARQAAGREIEHAYARIVAAWFRGADGIYNHKRAQFCTDGRIATGLTLTDIHAGTYSRQSSERRLALDMLGTYLYARVTSGDTGPVIDWTGR